MSVVSSLRATPLGSAFAAFRNIRCHQRQSNGSAMATLFNDNIKLSTQRFNVAKRYNGVYIIFVEQVRQHNPTFVSAQHGQQHLPNVEEKQMTKTIVARNQIVDMDNRIRYHKG
jgi:hypothetical protein